MGSLRARLSLIGLLLSTLAGPVQAGVTPSFLRCEYLVDPLGVDEPRPRLSWILESSERGQAQQAYQALVASTAKRLAAGCGDLWDSRKVASSQSLHVIYAGRPLSSGQQVFWKVRVWDRQGRASAWSSPARWQMGLLRAGDWRAKWIAHPSPVSSALPPRNGYHSTIAGAPDTAKWVAVQLAASAQVDAVRLFPARPFNWQPDTPGFLFPIRFYVEAANSPDFSDARRVLERTAEDVASPGANSVLYSFPAVKARYVRLTVTRLRNRAGSDFGFALAELQVLAGQQNVAAGAKVLALDSIENAGWSKSFLVDGDLVSHGGTRPEAQPATLLRKTFDLPQPVKQATVFASALGLYQLRLNGAPVGDHVLPPEWTDYHTRVQYQTYDVSRLLRQGENVLGAILGDGWYAGRIGMSDGLIGVLRGVYGPKPWLRAQLQVELANGRRLLVTSDGAWLATKEGPIRSSDLLDGEVYDARREMPGWDRPGFAGAGWTQVEARERIPAALVAQPNEPIRVIEELKPVALAEPKPGVFVFDLGQNMVGRCRLSLSGPGGTPVTIRHAEMTNEDGMIYVANLRGAPQVDRYVLQGRGIEVYEPAFTQHGFRFVEVAGLSQKPDLGAVMGRVFNSAAREAGRFECSEPLLNQLWRNILWTERANLMSAPTDCPQRDERLGWMGDIQAFSQTGIFNLDLAAFFTKWVQDVRDAQADDGRYPDFAPHPFGRNERFCGVPAWGDAGVVVPWRCYVNYADRRMLERHLASATRWVEFIRQKNPDLLWRQARHNDYNDWLNGDTLRRAGWPAKGGMVPQEVFATAFFCHSTDLVARMAGAIGRQEEARKHAELSRQIRAAFNRAFVQSDGRIQGDTQAGYALALHFDLLPEDIRPLAVRRLLEALERYQGRLSTGIQTTHRMMLELVRWGHAEAAWRLLTSREFPSWGFMIDNGATTIWERWDGYVPGRGLQDPGMNSFNHWALGSVGEWLYRHILGLNPDETAPGYEHFTIHPRLGGGLTWARGSYDSIRGRIAADWRVEAGRLRLKVTVPVNSTATVCLPKCQLAEVRESGQPAAQAPGVRASRQQAEAAVFEVGSGDYDFDAPLRER